MWGPQAVPTFCLQRSPAKDLSPQLGLSWGEGGGKNPGHVIPVYLPEVGWGRALLDHSE